MVHYHPGGLGRFHRADFGRLMEQFVTEQFADREKFEVLLELLTICKMPDIQENVQKNVFDCRTTIRLDRERLQTIKGLLAWINREKKREEAEELNGVKKHEEEKIDSKTSETKKSREFQAAIKSYARSDYRLTKLSKLKAIQLKNETEKGESLAQQYRKEKFCAALMKLRTSLLRQQWSLTCHYKERMLIRANIRLKNISRIRSEYGIPEILPADSIVFDKILKYKLEKRKQTKLRKERMIKIIQKIVHEMQPIKKKCLKYRKILSEISDEESSIKFPTEETASNYQNLLSLETKLEQKEEDKIISKISEDVPEFDKTKKQQDKKIQATDDILRKEDASTRNNNSKEAILIKKIGSSVTEIFPKDNCFFSNPNIITFDDFKAGRKYFKRVKIVNKSSKWAYIRFNKIDTEIWEPGVVEIDVMDAARVKPGMHSTINVKFSPVYDGKVTAEISFLTLSPDNTNTFHEFRIPVICKPQNPEPVVNPTEIRFPTAPAWKFNEPKYGERMVTISNEGRKSFSAFIGKRDDRRDYFLWHFEQFEMTSARSSVVSSSSDGPSRKLYHIEVPPKVKCYLRITFLPRHVGLHHEVMKIYLARGSRVYGAREVPIWAEVIGPQIHLDPPCIDLGIAMVDVDVCQQNFRIINSGKSSVQVFMKTPKRLENHVTIRPKSTILQPEIVSTISVMLKPESSIQHLSKRFYDPVSNMLDFPLQVQTVSREEEKPPPLILKVLATLTTYRGLILEPAQVNLGTVHTHESVYTELFLTNDSLLIQEYGFPFLPMLMEVQPNDGFGTILPGETIKLHLIYSARCTDIPGNEIGANGLADLRCFQIRVVTLAELASHKKEMRIGELKDLYDREKQNLLNRGFPPPLDHEPTEALVQTEDEGLEDSSNLAQQVISDVSIDMETPDADEIVDLKKLNGRDRRLHKNLINIQVHIVDTFCEMSEQILEFPATPCGSFTAVSVQLRAYNNVSYPNCTCGLLKNQEKDFLASFEFKSSSSRVKITPERGTLRSKQFIKVFFIFKPRLPIIRKTDEPKKAERSKKRDKSKERSSEKSEKKPKKKKTDEDEEASDADKLSEEPSLLETLDPRLYTIFATCFIDVEMKDGTKRDELLFVKLVCPVTRPEILILNKDPDVSFGPTAVGISSRKILQIKNISTKSVKVDVSLLNPHGSFFAPPGRMIETGSILNLPITYRPLQPREEEEYFEVSSSRSRTRCLVKVSGRGVVPSYVLKPRFGVARLKITDDKPVEIKISIQNTGQCPLTFRFRIKDTLEGNIPVSRDESPQENRKKEKADMKSLGKSSANVQFGDVLQSHEQLLIFEGGLASSAHPECFSFSNLDENTRLLVPQGRKMEFGIIFQRPKKQLSKEEEKSGEKPTTKKKKGKDKKKEKETSKKEDTEKLKYCYVALVELTLGGSVHVQDFIIICSLK